MANPACPSLILRLFPSFFVIYYTSPEVTQWSYSCWDRRALTSGNKWLETGRTTSQWSRMCNFKRCMSTKSVEVGSTIRPQSFI